MTQSAEYLEVMQDLEAARSRRELIAAAQRIQRVPGTSDQERLARIVRRRLDEFKSR